ncbi:MAG: hypothetical protein K2F63_04160, partial [Muribaculaceae bacterium]|nr:hypothetical protein [Muribaculaceae bacterium]
IWGPMKEWFTQTSSGYKYIVVDNADPDKNNVSSPSDVEGGFNGNPEYFSLLRISSKSDWYHSGYSWRMAHYLSPIAEDHFVMTTEIKGSNDLETSTIYQNPYWGKIHSTPAQQ